MIEEKLKELVHNTWKHFDKFTDKKQVVSTMPILYFGDLEAYKNSKFRIVTAALNPSDMEFTNHKDNKNYTFFRFPSANKINREHDSLNNEEVEAYIQSLNSYFTNKDENNNLTYYSKWFNPNEYLLNGIDASYFSKKYENTVLHTDICTPLATNPTWGKGDLNKGLKEELIKSGLALWQELIRYLQPDVILLSAGQDHVRKKQAKDPFGPLNFSHDEKFHLESIEEFLKYETKVNGEPFANGPLIIELHKFMINSKNCYLFYDTGGNGYFKNLGGDKVGVKGRKNEVGQEIKKYLADKK